jgi:hypothetical protein
MIMVGSVRPRRVKKAMQCALSYIGWTQSLDCGLAAITVYGYTNSREEC